MAYIKTEEVAEIRNKLKEEFGKRFKFSVTRYDHSGVKINIMEMTEGDLDLLADKNTDGYDEEAIAYFQEELNKGHIDVNDLYIEEHWRGETKKVLSRINEICQETKPAYNRHAGDPGSDYGDWTYFIQIAFGKSDKPLKIKEPA